MTLPPSPRRRKLRMLRAAALPFERTVVIRATPASVDEAVLDIAETALDSAEIYEVERPDGRRVALYGVSVFARPAGGDTGELLRPGQCRQRRRARRTTSSTCGVPGGASMRGSAVCSSTVKSSLSSRLRSSAAT